MTDIAYLYDGSFEGLLCCVYASYYQRELPTMIFGYEQAQGTLFPVKEIATDSAAAKKVEDSIVRKISREALGLTRLCYLSQMESREMAILSFLRLGYKVGAPVTNMLAHDDVCAVTKGAKNVQREGMFFREFLRFSDYDGALVATIGPKNFVLPLVAPHFCDRFPSERFMIYDKSHGCAFVYQDGEKSLTALESLELPRAGEQEEHYRALWKRFYNTIAIEGRLNPKLRMGNMPKRYWAHMTEFIDNGQLTVDN